MGDVKAGSRRREIGARDRIVSRLRTTGEVTDPSGLASNALAEAVGYPGSSVAFAQLLSGMERAGLIEREIRGRRTYRIRLADGAAPCDARLDARALPSVSPASTVRGADLRAPGNEGRQEPGPDARDGAGIDYDELARRLLVQVVRRLATAPAAGPAPSAGARPGRSEPVPATGQAALAETVAGLERKLAGIQSRQRKLSAENARLRKQLAAAQQSLVDIQHTAARSRRLDAAEVQMLQRLLPSLHADPAQRESAEAG